MKKKNLSSLRLKKNKISNLYNLNKFIGGTDGGSGSEQGLVTLNTNCGTCFEECLISIIDETACITNDTIRSLRETAGIACNALNTGEEC